MAEDVDLGVFETLSAGDILFIDSTHVVKTGSDVVYEISTILPRLNPGVLIHIHDIFYPFEYPKHWIIDRSRSWNEIYMVRAFLQGNSDFKIIMFNHYYGNHRLPADAYGHDRFRGAGGLWLEKVG